MTKYQKLIAKEFSFLQPRFDFALAPFTYMQIGGPAEIFFDLKKTPDIIKVISFCHRQKIPLIVIGSASNVLVPDKGLKGVVIALSNDEYQVTSELVNEKYLIRVGAGYRTALFVRRVVEDGYRGLESFLGVPGKLGGAIYNNAHYLADLIGEHVYRVQIITSRNQIKWLTQADCHFAYDSSVFQKTKNVILQIEFLLAKGSKAESQRLIKEAVAYRAKTQPLNEPSSGCYFQNVPNSLDLKKRFPQFAQRREVPAGFLIDQVGLKGLRVGDIEVSQKHAAFFINRGAGTSSDVLKLAKAVKQQVKKKFKVTLQEEVFFLKN